MNLYGYIVPPGSLIAFKCLDVCHVSLYGDYVCHFDSIKGDMVRFQNSSTEVESIVFKSPKRVKFYYCCIAH